MPDDTGKESTRSNAPVADESEVKAPAAGDEEQCKGETTQDPPGPANAGEQAAPLEEMKVVVSIKGGKATIGVQQPSSDPHIETFEVHDLSGLAGEVPAVTERAKARWEDTPRHPVYERPAPPARRRNRRQQRTAQEATADAETEQQQQTLRLF